MRDSITGASHAVWPMWKLSRNVCTLVQMRGIALIRFNSNSMATIVSGGIRASECFPTHRSTAYTGVAKVRQRGLRSARCIIDESRARNSKKLSKCNFRTFITGLFG